jgi:MFS family permease
MIWIYVIGPAALGLGMVMAGFRRKDKEPRKKVAVLSVALILLFSLCMFLTPMGGIAVNIGAWMVSTAQGGGWKTFVGTAIIMLICFACAFLAGGVIRDIAKDACPDRPTYLACMLMWLVVGLAVGIVGGPIAYDEFTAEVMRATVEASR